MVKRVVFGEVKNEKVAALADFGFARADQSGGASGGGAAVWAVARAAGQCHACDG